MTIVGKILTLFIFFMSLVFLGMTYGAMSLIRDPKSGESWRDLYLQERAQRENQAKDQASDRKARLTYDDQIKTLQAENQTLKANFAAELKKAQDDAVAAQRERDEDRARFAKTQLLVDQLTAELTVRRNEVAQLTSRIAAVQAEVAEKSAEITRITNEANQAKYSRDTYKTRMDDLYRQVQELNAAVERERQAAIHSALASTSGTNEALISRPPPEDVRGEIREVGAEGLVAITIGSDQGLLRGHTLEVYRLEPKPQYLGRLRILDVEPQQAVGKLLNPQYNKLVQPKDIVSNRIMYNK